MANKERVALWEQALRNPELVQGNGRLAARVSPGDPWQQCCLDVACRVAMDNGVELQECFDETRDTTTTGTLVKKEKRGYMDFNGSQSNWTGLPQTVMDWYGLDSTVVMPLNGKPCSAVTMNDMLRMPFPEIADAIHDHFLSEDAA